MQAESADVSRSQGTPGCQPPPELERCWERSPPAGRGDQLLVSRSDSGCSLRGPCRALSGVAP